MLRAPSITIALGLSLGITMGVAAPLLAGPGDADGDGVTDDVDNCTLVANASQTDTDQDGFGNACDTDWDQNGISGVSDYGLWLKAWGGCVGEPEYNEDVDIDDSGCVTSTDFNLWLTVYYTLPPGPSGLACADPTIDVDGSYGGTNNTPCP